MANLEDLLGGIERGAVGRAGARLGAGLLSGGAGALGRIAYKASDPDEGDYFQLAFGFLPTFNLGSYLGIENGLLRFAVDALADPMNALELPFTLAKAGQVARSARFLSRAEKGEQALRVVKARGLLATEGRGLEFLDAVRRGDAAGLRGFKDLLDAPADEATLKFFRGEEGRHLRDFIFSSDAENLPVTGLAKQARAGHRPLLRARTPFGLRTLLGDREVVLAGGGKIADLLERVPVLGPALQKLGSGVARDIAYGLKAADATSQAFRSAEAMRSAAEELAAEYPQVRGLQRELDAALPEMRAAHAEYVAARTANSVAHGDLGRLGEQLAHEVEVFGSERAAKGSLHAGPERAGSILARVAAVADGESIDPGYVGFLQGARGQLERLREYVPGEYRRILGEYDSMLAQAIADPGAARRLAGSEALRGIVERRAGELATGVEELRAGRVPEAAGREPVIKAAAKEAKLAEAPAAAPAPGLAPEDQAAARLEPAARELERQQPYVDALLRALPTGAADPARIVGAADRVFAAGDQLGRAVTRAASEIRALSIREGAKVEPLVRRFAESAATMAGNIGIVKGGEAAKEFREAIGAAWPEMGRELDVLHASHEMSLEDRAVEADLLAGLNPAYSHDFGGPGAGIRNLYGAGFDPRSLQEGHFSYLGQMQARSRRYFDMYREDWRRLGRDPEQSLKFMRAFEIPNADELSDKAFGQIAGLSDREVAMWRSARRLLSGFEAIGHGRWFEQAILDYFPRIARKKAGVSEALYRAKLSDAAKDVAARGRVTTRFARPRMLDSLDELLALERQGVLEVEKNPGAILEAYVNQWSQVAANQRLVDIMAANRGADGMPLLLERAKAAKWAKSMGLSGEQMNARYTEWDVKRVPALAGFLVHKDHAGVAAAFGPQTLQEVVRDSDPLFRALFGLNLAIKGGILSFSFFHAAAQSVSILASAGLRRGSQFLLGRSGLAAKIGSAGLKPGTFYELYGQAGELLEHGIRHGLQIDSFDKLAADEFRGFMGSLLKAVETTPPGATGQGPGGPFKMLVSPIVRGAKHFNDLSHKVTWEYIHNAGKAFLYGENLRRLMKALPNVPLDELAKQAAESANLTLGGLNWRKVFGDARVRARLQYFFLAPDWTLSNLAQARDVFLGMFGDSLQKDRLGRFALPIRDVANPQAAATLARRFWLNVGVGGLLTMQLLNVAMTGHTTFDNPGGPENWTKISLGIKDEDGRPVFAQFGHQFADPFKLFLDPWGFIGGRTAPWITMATGVLLGRDRYGTPIRVPADSNSRKSLDTLGWVAGQTLPIPGQGAVKAVKQAATGKPQSALLTALNIGTSMVDLQIRPAPILEGDKKAAGAAEPRGALADDLPTTMPPWARASRQARFVVMED